MADISQITMPDGTTYNIKDTVARQSGGGGGTGTLVAVYTAATYDLELRIDNANDADNQGY